MQINNEGMEQSKPNFVEVDALKERRIEEISNITYYTNKAFKYKMTIVC
jgi:hypothetical protein